ncbi:Oidioi.mRNA.OKI2018_I69.chr1.g1190.t1.cds [Oikopleura dioica]|uniref:Metalloendopeptidase n=1 Tax=Oikopleura dioica TaxID=34765 RepID=A0ABN7SM63_OIKDI|nr:Oidioi.mRNA.OKI2018_I69.chr1.g1190.t1.cds [Oikopleura dioica]
MKLGSTFFAFQSFSSADPLGARGGISCHDLSEYEGDPFMVNYCKEILAEAHCSFKSSECPVDDCLFGHKRDSTGCVIDSCICDTEPQGKVHFGDIMVDGFVQNMMTPPDDTPRDPNVMRAADISVPRWTDYREGGFVYIPYRISRLNPLGQRAALAGMKILEDGSCLRFRERSDERDFMDFFIGDGCYSWIGKLGGAQEISLGVGCHYASTAAHEIMHALGFHHEQMRPDRDSYVQYIEDNVEPEMRHNFKTIHPSKWNSYGQPYDVNSVMQYSGYSFTRNWKPTLLDRSTGKPTKRNTKLTESDFFQINALYGCEETSTPTPTTKSTTTTATTATKECRDFDIAENIEHRGNDITSFQVSPGEAGQRECEQSCRSNPDCGGFTLYGENRNPSDSYRCFLKSSMSYSMLLTSGRISGYRNKNCPSSTTTPTTKSTTRPTTTTKECRDFEIEENVEYLGNDVASFQVSPGETGQRECEESCRSSPGCAGYTFYEWHVFQPNHCFLKTNTNVKRTNIADRISGRKTGDCGASTSTPTICADLSGYESQCASWKSYGFCTSYSRTSMEHYCAKTCGFCASNGESCTDEYTYCASLAADGECSRNSAFMLKSCKKSCGKC